MRQPTWHRPLVVEKTRSGNGWYIYYSDEPAGDSYIEGYYEKGNYAASNLHYRFKWAWEWLCGFLDYLRGKRL